MYTMKENELLTKRTLDAYPLPNESLLKLMKTRQLSDLRFAYKNGYKQAVCDIVNWLYNKCSCGNTYCTDNGLIRELKDYFSIEEVEPGFIGEEIPFKNKEREGDTSCSQMETLCSSWVTGVIKNRKLKGKNLRCRT